MGIIKDEYRDEYEKRAKEIQSIFINAYFDYYYLRSLEPYLEKFQPKTDDEVALLLPARNFVNSVVRAIQEEFILVICSLENKDGKANSLHQLKGRLHIFLDDFYLYQDSLLKMPTDDDNIKIVRNVAVAHINLNIECEGVYIEYVKNRLNILKDRFNSYLFDDMLKYKIDDNLIDKVATESRIGVQQLFSGFVSAICDKSKLEGE